MPISAYPSWLTEPCPHWCTRTHLEDDHPDDRAHTSSPVEIPAVERRIHVDTHGLHYNREGVTLQVGLHQVVGEPEIWVYIGDGTRRGIETTPAAASELANALSMTANACINSAT